MCLLQPVELWIKGSEIQRETASTLIAHFIDLFSAFNKLVPFLGLRAPTFPFSFSVFSWSVDQSEGLRGSLVVFKLLTWSGLVTAGFIVQT